MKRKYDLIVYGATGFVGRLCCKYLKVNYPEISWAMAGRNQRKLERVKVEQGLSQDILVADANDREALDRLAVQTTVMLSTAGPFMRYGSKLVAACVAAQTHYTDITGENHWTRGLIDRHHEDAARTGTRIVPSCGYDSVPSDMGTFFAVTQMNKPVKRVESFHAALGTVSGGTLETMFDIAKIPADLKGRFLTNPPNTVSKNKKKNPKVS